MGGSGADGEEAGPPYSLLEHMPLAVFTNGLLSAFNELRHCALLSLSIPVAQIVQVGHRSGRVSVISAVDASLCEGGTNTRRVMAPIDPGYNQSAIAVCHTSLGY